METLLFLFPQFNYMAQKEEAYCKTPRDSRLQATMKDESCRHKDKERKSRLSLFLTKSGSHENVSPHKKTNTTPGNSVSPEDASKWSESFEDLMKDADGVEVFSQFLRSEFSEENILFWLACEDFRTIDSHTKLLSKTKYIYTVFIESDAPKEINIDYSTRVAIERSMSEPTKSCFDAAQAKVYSLMQKDSYPRFLNSDLYLQLTRSKAPMFRRRSRSCVFNERGEATSAPSAW